MRQITAPVGILVFLAILMACSLGYAFNQPFGMPEGTLTALKSTMFSPKEVPFSSVRAVPDLVKSAVDFIVVKILRPNVKYDPRASVVEVVGFKIPNFVFLILILIALAAAAVSLYIKTMRSPSLKDDFIAIVIFYFVVLVIREVLTISGFESWAGLVSSVLIASFILIALLSGRGSIMNKFWPFAIVLLGGLLILLLSFPTETATGIYEVLVRIKSLGMSIFIEKNLIMVPVSMILMLATAWHVIQTHGQHRGQGEHQ